MATKNVQLPEIGEGVTEGELVNWLVKIGDRVEPDQPVAEIMTDKATVEVPSPVGGTVKELKIKEGNVVEVGNVMLVLDTDGAAASSGASAASGGAKGEAAVAPAASKSQAPAAGAPAKVQAPSPGQQAPAASMRTGQSSGGSNGGMEVYPPAAASKVLATPATRRLAREMNVDINQLRGSGIAGRVTREDVVQNEGQNGGQNNNQTSAKHSEPRSALTQIPRQPYQGIPGASEERVQLKGIRKKIAENLQMAKQIIPHFTLMDEATVTALVDMRQELKAVGEKAGVKITYLPFVVKALIATIREFPMFNASIDDAASEIVYKKYFNIGFAADTPNGLLVPVIKDADHKTILQIAREITELSKKARDGKLSMDEMKGATITITNIGSVGGTYATPIINHPEVAILGMYKISDKPVIKNGALAAEKVMNFSVTADHRLIDGAVAANFLKAFIQRIENPGALMLDMM